MNIRSIIAGRRVAALALATAVSGCAFAPLPVRTEVTSYNEWATLPAERTYAFSRTLEYRSSLEVASFEDIVRDQLAAQGFRFVADPNEANLVVTLRPSVVDTRVRVPDPWPIGPFWSPYGFYGRGGFGGWGGWGGYGGFGAYGPSFYDDFRSYTVDVFHRKLEMDIDSRTIVGRRYYEGRVETSSQADGMKDVVPYLVRALFSDFPGNNGQTRRVDVPVERK